MPHVQLNNDMPGIIGLMGFRPETAKPLNELAETLPAPVLQVVPNAN